MNGKIIIGSRGSRLALWQAHYVENALKAKGFTVEIKIIKTQGDKIKDQTFDKLEGKGFFTKELEDSLLDDSIDLAVHSYKDLPTENPEGLVIAGNSYRDRPEDWLLINKKAVDFGNLWNLKKNARVGTSSPRRVAQLLAFRPDLKIVPIRGNVPTRVKKIDEELDAVVLAGAGLVRLALDLSAYEVYKFDSRKFIPAAVQGVLAYQIKKGNKKAKQAVAALHDEAVAKSVYVERKILNKLEGGCQLPIGVYCETSTQKGETVYHVWAFYQAKFNVQKPKIEVHKRLFRTGKNADKLIKEVVADLKSAAAKTVFISRPQTTKSYFKTHLEALGYQVEGNSLINFKLLNLKNIPPADWIFFSSRKGVQFLFELAQQLNVVKTLLRYKIACMGSGTADELRLHGFTPNFVGNDEGIEIVASEFLAFAKNQQVLFPQAKNSKQSIQKLLDSSVQVIDLDIYENAPIQHIEPLLHDVLVFTSSMNAQAYFLKHKLNDYQRVIAIGATTADTLRSLGIKKVEIAWQASELGLVDVF